MSRLFDISERMQAAMNAIESGEVDSEFMADTIDGLGYEFEEKAKGLAMVIRNYQEDARSQKELAAQMAEKASKSLKNAERLMDYLDVNMRKLKREKVECGYFNIVYANNRGSVNVVDFDALPKKFINSKTTESANKKAIKEAINSGEKVKGAELVKGKTLKIK